MFNQRNRYNIVFVLRTLMKKAINPKKLFQTDSLRKQGINFFPCYMEFPQDAIANSFRDGSNSCLR